MNHFTDFLSPVAKNAPASHSDNTALTLSIQGGIMKRFATVLSSLSPSADKLNKKNKNLSNFMRHNMKLIDK